MHKKKHIWCSIMIILIVAFDQITKYLAEHFLNNSGGQGKVIIKSFLQLRYVQNTGMAFSMFSGARWAFVALTLIVCVGALWYLFSNRCKSLWLYWSVGVVVAGGIGNLIDRVIYGYVVDFIEPLFVNFAVFNIADCAVTCGAVVLIGYLVIDSFTGDKKDEQKH